jgi:hypothetical protein
MDEKALEYAFGLFQQDGYTGTLDEYKELIGKDQEALDYSFDLFSNDGYSGNKDQFSALVMPGKTEPIAPGVAVEETAAPDLVGTELQSEAGSSESRENLFKNQGLQFISDKIGSVGYGAAGILEGVGDFIEMPVDLATSKIIDVYNYFSQDDITTQEKTFIRQKIDDIFVFDELFGAVGDQFEKMKTVRDDKSILDRIEDKDYLTAIDQTISGVFQGIPSVMASLNPFGLAALGFSAAGSSYEELSEAAPDRVGFGMAANAIAQGTVELVSERLTRGLFNGTVKAFGGGKPAVAKAATILAKNMFFEGASETAAQEVNNVLDTRFGINRFTDKNGNFDGRALLERSFDTFLVSSLIGGGTTVAGGVAGRQRELMYERLTPTKAKDLYSKIGKYAQTLQSENESQQSSGPVFEENVKNIEELEQELQNVRKRVKTVYDTYSNPELAEMVQLKSEISEIEAEMRNVNLSEAQRKDRRLRIKNREKQIDETFDTKYKVLRDKNIAATESLMKDLNFDTKISFSDTVDANGEFRGNGEIIINQKQADSVLDFAVGGHELLHPILNALVGDTNAQSRLRNQFETQLTKKQKNWVQGFLDRNVDKSQHDTEYINVFADGVVRGEIKYVDGVFNNIGNLLKSLFRKNGFKNIDFNSGKGIYNFIGAYSKGLKSGKFDQRLRPIIQRREEQRGVKVAEVGTASVSQAEQKSQYENIVKALGTDQTKDQWNDGGANAAISKLGTPIQNDPKGESIFQKLIGGKITTEIRGLPKFSEEDFISETILELIPHINNFNPEINNNLSGWINSQLQNKVNSTLKSGKATGKEFEQSLSVFDDQETSGIQIESDYIESTTMVDIRKAELDRVQSLADPVDLLGEQDSKIYYNAAAEKVAALEFKGLTLANAKDVAPELTAKLFGMKLNAYLGINKEGKPTSVNFSGDKTKAQQLIYDNADLFISLLPEGAILENDAASKDLEGTGVRIPRNLQKAFYDQQARLSKGAGLEPYKLKDNITKKDFLSAFGINTNGTFKKLANGSREAISMIGFARLVGRLMTNTAARAEMAKRVENGEYTSEEVQDLAAGKSDIQKSHYKLLQEAMENFGNAEDALPDNVDLNNSEYSKAFNNTIDKVTIPSSVPDVPIDDEAKKTIKEQNLNDTLENSSSGKQTWIIEDLLNTRQMQLSLLDIIPKSISQSLTFIKGFAGYHYRYGFGIKIYEDGKKQFVSKNNTNKFLTTENSEISKLKALESADTLNEAANKESNFNFTPETKRMISLVETAMRKRKKLPYWSPQRNSNKKKQLAAINNLEDFQSVMQELFNDPDNETRVLAYNALNFILTDFVHEEGISTQEKVGRIVFVKKLKATNSNIAGGSRGLIGFSGGIFNESVPDNERVYRFEHFPAVLQNETMAFANIVMNKKHIITPEIWYNDSAVQADIDRTPQGKTGNKKVKKSYIPNSEDVKILEKGYEPRTQQSRALKLSSLIDKSVGEFDRFDMADTVAKRLFPNEANSDAVKAGRARSYEALNDTQKLQVLQDMQNNGLISKDSQLSRASKLADLIGKVSDVNATAEISEKKARLLGKNKGKWKFFIPPSADDFAGLMYYMVGKGKKGNEDLAWFKQNLFDPFAKGINEFSTYRQFTMNQFRRMKKLLRSKNVKLKATNSTGFTNEVAVRVYVWATNGHEVPGLSEAEVKEMVNIVSSDPSLRNFAGQIINLTNFAETPAPEKSWDGGTLTTDILDYLNTSSREKFLEEYLSNAEEIFGKFGQSGEIEGETANRLRAAFGDNYVESLSDVLYRMKTGRRRISGSNRLTNQFVNWINDSVGAIMFFNTRSALLQQLSFVNFVNFSDNNPLAASRAFINQPQFWGDYVSLFNSDFLKERRSGLKTDVNADEIARAAEEGRNPVRAVIASLLKKGFLPTQIADSHAIALGGASFYRNRLNRYVKEGMTQEDAAKQAFVDFQEIAEETQQSSRPDRISMQQASGLGRLILAFANTPMQYARLTKKAALDLINRRGDWKTNLSKLMYYGAVQNVIFSSLQTALFALAFDDEEEEKTRNRYFRIANGTADGLLRGLGFGGAAVAAGKNMVLEGIRQSKLARPNYEEVAYEALKLSPPISSKIDKLASAGRMFTYRNTREKMKTAGFTLDNPIFESAGKIISATTNLPADRVIRKLDNLSTPVRQDVETWQAVSLALGYSKWDVGLIESKAKKPESSTTGLKKVKRKKLKRKKLN